MDESLRSLIEGSLAAQERATLLHTQLRLAQEAYNDASNQQRDEVTNLSHALANRVAVYGDNLVRVVMNSSTGYPEVSLIPLVHVLKAAPPKSVEPPAAKPPVPPPSHGTTTPKAGKK